MAAASTGLGNLGCLVPGEITFEQEENTPPRVFDRPGTSTPIGEMLHVNLSDLEANEIVFEFEVRDENVYQDLEARYQLSTLNPDNTLNPSDPQPLSISPSREVVRRVEFFIAATELRAGQCYRLDLVITSAFENLPVVWDKPRLENDIAKATWFIAVHSREPQVPINLETCPYSEYNPSGAETQ